MATILRTIEVDAPVDKVWAKVADTGQISNLIGFLSSSTQIDNQRNCTLDGGGELTEKIISVDHDLKRVMYTITQSPLNMEFHASAMQVQEQQGKTQLTWTVDLLPDEAKEHMAPMLDSACSDMKMTLAN